MSETWPASGFTRDGQLGPLRGHRHGQLSCRNDFVQHDAITTWTTGPQPFAVEFPDYDSTLLQATATPPRPTTSTYRRRCRADGEYHGRGRARSLQTAIRSPCPPVMADPGEFGSFTYSLDRDGRRRLVLRQPRLRSPSFPPTTSDYTVSLTVTDADGNSTSTSVTIPGSSDGTSAARRFRPSSPTCRR